MFKLIYEPQPHWPPLAWIAELRPGKGTIRVKHGGHVETAEEWCCEAVWDGNFGDGAFDRTDIIAGSGVRVRGNRLMLVSSGSTVDRLQSLRLADRLLVSNSLVCLLAEADASLNPAYPHYLP
ncbi:MAG TPA: hypothetical protein VML57_12500 [Burkholderiales bacterium]|nr:hypothetical protein [Burkholderiales bacterium]